MREPNRLNGFYNILKIYHKKYMPDIRFMQFINNFLRWHQETYNDDGFYVEDDEFLKRLNRYIAQYFYRK